MTVYQNAQAERISKFEPNETVGLGDPSVRDGSPAGAALFSSGNGGYILETDEHDFVSVKEFQNQPDLMMAWQDCIDRLGESEEGEPEEEDYVIEDKPQAGYFVTVIGETFESWNASILAIWDHMEANNFRPNVWTVSDHGNFSVIADFDEQVEKIKEVMRGDQP